MSTFQTDLIHDLLRRLPVKTLLRFKCVSKPWGSLIEDSDFAKLHLHQSLKTNTNIKLFLDNCIEDDDKAYSVDFDSMCNLVQFPRPFTSEITKYRSRIFGSSNGLLAVYHCEAGIALWNPSTIKCHYLPTLDDYITMDHDPIPGYHYDKNTILGFGYDVIGVCKIPYLDLDITMIKCPYDIPTNYNEGAYVNNSLHWVGEEIGVFFGRKVIFALDLGTEDHVNLWVMKEYGVRDSLD